MHHSKISDEPYFFGKKDGDWEKSSKFVGNIMTRHEQKDNDWARETNP